MHVWLLCVCQTAVVVWRGRFSVTFVAFDDGFKGIVVNVVGNPREDCQVPQATTKVHDDTHPRWVAATVCDHYVANKAGFENHPRSAVVGLR